MGLGCASSVGILRLMGVGVYMEVDGGDLVLTCSAVQCKVGNVKLKANPQGTVNECVYMACMCMSRSTTR